MWFAGVHSNVGGGYMKHGMSLVALDWMMAEAERCGLRFIQADRDYVCTHQDVHDELYNARAGLGMYYRWEPRDIVKLCRDHHMTHPKIHVSVFERIANGTGCYAPINLPHQCEVVRTNDERSWPSDQTLWAIERQVPPVEGPTSGRVQNGSLLDEMGRDIISGKWSYRIFVMASLSTVAWWYGVPPYLHLVLGGMYACIGLSVWRWSKRVDDRMESAAQNHWQRRRGALRTIFTDGQIQREPEHANKVA